LQAQNSEELFPTTSEDLAGFWDMVMLQVDHVNRLFEEITTLRAANWVEVNSSLIFCTLLFYWYYKMPYLPEYKMGIYSSFIASKARCHLVIAH
jgi:Guanylate-kinase-associated protein (GKAP) protein.